ncbi:MAG: hypothetical protein HY319_09840 [Armatimonadetes bacterium]|nr:hypothetical protein [Armatimonadota bacterium]
MNVQSPHRSQWTVLCFLNGRRGLQPDVERTVRQLESVGSGPDIQFVAQVFREDPYPGVDCSHVQKSSWLGLWPNSRSLAATEHTDPADPRTFQEFLVLYMKAFPAEHYLVLVESHGGAIGGICGQSLEEFQGAVEGATRAVGQTIDILALDSCLMGTAETAFGLKDSVGFLAASEELLLSDNLRYGKLAKELRGRVENGGLSVQQALTALHRARQNRQLSTASVIDCSKLDELAARMRPFARSLVTVADGPAREAIGQGQHYRQPAARQRSFQHHSGETPMDQMRDLVSVARRVEAGPGRDDEGLAEAARAVAGFVQNEVVVAESHDSRLGLADSHGLSLYAPVKGAEAVVETYRKLSFAAATGWDRVVERYGRSSADGPLCQECPPDPRISSRRTGKPGRGRGQAAGGRALLRPTDW